MPDREGGEAVGRQSTVSRDRWKNSRGIVRPGTDEMHRDRSLRNFIVASPEIHFGAIPRTGTQSLAIDKPSLAPPVPVPRGLFAITPPRRDKVVRYEVRFERVRCRMSDISPSMRRVHSTCFVLARTAKKAI